jgi:HlyD family secretion protein
LDTTDLDISVQKAQIALDKAKAELETTKAKATSDEIASDKAALTSAQAAYNVLVAGPTKDEVTSAAAALRQAEVAVQKAQTDYDKVSWQGGASATSESVALQDATLTYQKALADYNVAQKPPTDDEVKAAKAKIASAQYDLNTLLRGSTDAEIAVSQAAVDSAQIDLETAQRAVERALLTAPFAATVTSVSTDVGAYPLTDTPVMELADLGTLYANVPVDEIDRPAVKVGQAAIVTLDALPTAPLTGTVTSISPAPSSSSSDTATTYEVKVSVGTPPEGVSTGMTAKVEIQTESRNGVPVIPTSLVQTDSTTGETYVDKVGADGQAVRTTITLGLRSGTNIEVKSGLQVGDQVLELAGTQSTTVSPTTTSQSSGMLGIPGAGGPPPDSSAGSSSSSKSSSSGGK